MLGSAPGQLRKVAAPVRHCRNACDRARASASNLGAQQTVLMPFTNHQCSTAVQPTLATAAAAVPSASLCCCTRGCIVADVHATSTAAPVLSGNELPVPLSATKGWQALSSGSSSTSISSSKSSNTKMTTDAISRGTLTSQGSMQLPVTSPKDTGQQQSVEDWLNHNSMQPITTSSSSSSSDKNDSNQPSQPPATKADCGDSAGYSMSNTCGSHAANGCGSWPSDAHTDQRVVLAQQLQLLVLPGGQYDGNVSSVLQQAALIAAATGHTTAPGKTAATPASLGHMVGGGSNNKTTVCLVVSEQHLLLALLHHSPVTLQHVLNNTAAVPAGMAAAHATVQHRVAAAVAAAALYVEHGTAAVVRDQGSPQQPQEQASDLQWNQQQQQQQQQQHSILQLSPTLLHALLLARNASRQAGAGAGVLHVLHGLSSLPDAPAVFRQTLGAHVITADLRQQLELELYPQHLSHCTDGGRASSSGARGSSSTIQQHEPPETSWRSSSSNCSHKVDSTRSASSQSRYSRMEAHMSAGHTHGGRQAALNSITSLLFSSLTWVDTTLGSILVAAEQKDPVAAVDTLTAAITNMAQQQQHHRPHQQWLEAAWGLINERLQTYLSVTCYLRRSRNEQQTIRSVHTTDNVTDSVEESIQGAAHAEAVSLLSGVAAAAAVCLQTYDCKVQGMCSAVDQVMCYLSQFDGGDRWQLGGYNISDMYLPVMIRVLPVAVQIRSTRAVAAAAAAVGSLITSDIQQHQQQDQLQVQLADTSAAAAFTDVYNNFVRLSSQLAAMQQQGLMTSLLSSCCTPQGLAEALLTVLNMEGQRAGTLSSSSNVHVGQGSSTDAGAPHLLSSVVVALLTTLTTALRAGSGSSSSNGSRQVQTRGAGFSTTHDSHRTAGDVSNRQQQQPLGPETVVQVVEACHCLPSHLAGDTPVIFAATELTAAAWLSMAAATDDYTSEQLVSMLVAVRQNGHFLRYLSAVGAAVGAPSRAASTSSSSGRSEVGGSSSSGSREEEMKMLVEGTKQILHRLCTKRTLSPSEAAAALAVLDTPLWPTNSSPETAQSPLVQGLLSRVTESIKDMTATQLEQLLSVAIRLPWGDVGYKLSEEWMRRVLAAVVQVTADVAVRDLDVVTASTLAAALGDLCGMPVLATQQQMHNLQQALPLLLPKLDQRHTAMVLSFVSRQAQLHSQAAIVTL